MKLMGLMVVRNEDWVLRCSLNAALSWCDEVVLVDHSSSDGTGDILKEAAAYHPYRVHYSRWGPMVTKSTSSRFDGTPIKIQVLDETNEARWDEMEMRQHSLDLGRKFGGTHFAIIDGDEILTSNLVDQVRPWFNKLEHGKLLELPMLAMRSLDEYQDDSSVWSRAFITLGFRDEPILTWKPQSDGYQHHNRPPYPLQGRETLRPITEKKQGGVMHLQFANKRRLLAKHVLYRLADYFRWPNRDTIKTLNEKYDQALKVPEAVTKVHPSWWSLYDKHTINLQGVPWQEWEIKRLIGVHGREKCSGLDLKGF